MLFKLFLFGFVCMLFHHFSSKQIHLRWNPDWNGLKKIAKDKQMNWTPMFCTGLY